MFILLQCRTFGPAQHGPRAVTNAIIVRSSHYLAAHCTLILPFCLHIHDRVPACSHARPAFSNQAVTSCSLTKTDPLSLSSHVRASKRCGHRQSPFPADRALDPQAGSPLQCSPVLPFPRTNKQATVKFLDATAAVSSRLNHV